MILRDRDIRTSGPAGLRREEFRAAEACRPTGERHGDSINPVPDTTESSEED